MDEKKSYVKSSIRLSLMMSLGFVMIAVSIFMTLIIGRTVLKSNKEQITKSIVTLTESKGDSLERIMTEMVYSAEALSGMLGGSWAIPEKQRQSAEEQAVRAMVKSSRIDSAWSYWIPGMFDHKDSLRADPDYNPSGHMQDGLCISGQIEAAGSQDPCQKHKENIFQKSHRIHPSRALGGLGPIN